MNHPTTRPLRSRYPIAALMAACMGVALSTLTVGACGRANAGSAAADTIRVLMIGNSYTYFHNSPAILERIAASLDGPVIRTRLLAHGGWTLADHWADTATQTALHAQHWDWVVLQEQSTLGDTYLVDGKNRVHSATAFAASAAQFAAEAKRVGARVAIVGHWSRRDAPPRDDAALRFAFDSVARALGAVLVPAGAAWRDAAIADGGPDLYFADGSHPSEAGSYLLASVLYAALTSRDPAGAAASVRGPLVELEDGIVHRDSIVTLVDLDHGTAERLQRAAWNVWSEARRDGGFLPAPRPAPMELPTLSARHDRVEARALVGSWRGTTTIYPVSPPAVLELRIEAAGDSLRGTLRRALRPTAAATEVGPVSVRVADDVVTITDPKGPNGGTVRYRGVLANGTLSGVVEFLIPAPTVYGIGRWTLERTP